MKKWVLILILLMWPLYLMNVTLVKNDTALDTLRSEMTQTLDLSVLDSCGIITNSQGYGSCVAIRPNLMLTAGHCIGMEGAWIEVDGQQYKILKQWKSEQYDVGFVEIDGELPFVKLVWSNPKLLDEIYVIGSPLHSMHKRECVNNITKGIISNIGVDWGIWTDGIIVDAAAYPGNSGGPLLDKDSRIIGIMVGCHNRISKGGDNFWLAESIGHILSVLEEYDATT